MLEGQTYVFQSPPRAVHSNQHGMKGTKRRMFRDLQRGDEEATLVRDPRIRRGLTQGTPVYQPQPPQEDGGEVVRKSKPIRPRLLRSERIARLHQRIRVTPKKTAIPLHMYLEEHVTAPACTTQSAQTDAFLQKRPQAPYIPAKTGVDSGTQIDNDIVFSMEDSLNSIVGHYVDKVLEQALLEVRQEEEFAFMHDRTLYFNELELKERKRAARMEADERRRQSEAQTRLQQLRAHKQRERLLQRNVVATALATQAVSAFETRSLEMLEQAGVFKDPTREVCAAFLPSVVQTALASLQRSSLAKQAVAATLGHALRPRTVEKEEEEGVIELFIHSTDPGKNAVGPLELPVTATVGDLSSKVHEWLVASGERGDLQRLCFSLSDGVVLANDRRLSQLGVEALARLQMRAV